MIRLTVAEFRKLNRPLTWGVAVGMALFCVLLAVGGASNSQRDLGSQERAPSCEQMNLPAGPACDQATRMQQGRLASAEAEQKRAASKVHAQLSPFGAGAESAGLMASMPGALAIALLAGGHVGGEWSGRTLKHLLTQQGRRSRVVAAKLISLWGAGVGVMGLSWCVLAVTGPLISRADRLPANSMGLTAPLAWSVSQCGRSLLVVGFFVVIGVTAATVTRNTIGTMTAAAAVIVAMLVAASLPSLGNATPATWVQGWMGFAVGEASITSLPSNFWSRFIDPTGASVGQAASGLALVAVMAACVTASTWTFRRSDVVG